MSMKRFFIFLIIFVSCLQSVQSQTVDSSRSSVCATPYPVVASANNGVGYINFCVYYPEVVQPSEVFAVVSILTGPTTLAPLFSTAAAAFTVNTASTSQCTEGSPSAITPSSNGLIGTSWTATTSFTMLSGAERCDFAAFATLTIGPSLQVYNTVLTMNVQTENFRVDNFNYLCDAPGIVPNVYSTSSTTCNDLITSLSGTITVADDIDGWIIHQDSLSGTINIVNSGGQNITIDNWPELQAVISGEIDIHQDEACGATVITACQIDMTCLDDTCRSNVTIGNISNEIGNITNNPNLNLNFATLPLLLVAIAFFAVMGETRKDALYWFIAMILSIYLLIQRNEGSGIIPIGVYVGWIFVTLYQGISLLMTKRAQNLSSTEE